MNPTERVPLRTLSVTRLGLGLAPIGGLYSPVPEAQAIATVDRAYELGLRLFDTAPLYGYGLSERRAGKALSGRPRAEYVLATKVGRLLVPGGGDGQDFWPQAPRDVAPVFDFSYDGVMRSHAESCERLGVDRIDLLHLHDPDDHEEEALEEGYRALAELRAAGQIGAISAGMNDAAPLARFALGYDFDCFMIAGRYTLLDTSAIDELLPRCAERGIGILAAGVFNSGLLSDPRPGAHYDYAVAPPELVSTAQTIERICQQYGVPLRAAALQFPFGHPAVTSVVVGARSPAEIEENARLCALPIPPELWAELKKNGLLPEEVPTP